MSTFEQLIGKKVVGLKVSDDKEIITFFTEDDALAWMAEGDCCSSSWIESVNDPEMVVGHTVNRVVTRDMPDVTPDGHYGSIQAYGWTLETDAGRCDIEMRNESNGYYGGWLRFIK